METYNLSPEEILSTQETFESQGEILRSADVDTWLHQFLLQEIDERSKKPDWTDSPAIPEVRQQIELSADADIAVFQQQKGEGVTEYWITRVKVGESFVNPQRKLLQVLADTELPIAYRDSDSSIGLHPTFERLFSVDETSLPMPTQEQLRAIVSAGDQYSIGVDIKECPKAYVDSVGARATQNKKS